MAETRKLDLGRNHLLYGDCLDTLKLLADDSVDLIYLDPPFKSDTDYNMLFGMKADMPTPRNPYSRATYRHTDTRQGELL